MKWLGGPNPDVHVTRRMHPCVRPRRALNVDFAMIVRVIC
jgi:hypothetical protein